MQTAEDQVYSLLLETVGQPEFAAEFPTRTDQASRQILLTDPAVGVTRLIVRPGSLSEEEEGLTAFADVFCYVCSLPDADLGDLELLLDAGVRMSQARVTYSRESGQVHLLASLCVVWDGKPAQAAYVADWLRTQATLACQIAAHLGARRG